MDKKIYVKDTSFDPIYKDINKGFFTHTRVIPTLLVFGGLLIFSTQVFVPLVFFKTQNDSNEIVDNATVLGRAAGFYEFEFDELDKTNDFNNDIFLEGEYIPRKKPAVLGFKTENIPEYFYITIPKLKIEKAQIKTNEQSLNPTTSLGHYPGTELPGEVGNSFIYGHSVLPWFFNPKNYKTIFSTLGDLEPGDEFSIEYNNKEYNYIVESKESLTPNKVDPLGEFKPKYLNESTVTLMTCSPPGTKLKRLLVNAVLVN